VDHAKNEFACILSAVDRSKEPAKVPLYEHFVDDQIIEQVLGVDFSRLFPEIDTAPGVLSEKPVADRLVPAYTGLWSKRLEFYRQLGYDYLPVEFPPLFSKSAALRANDTALYSKGQRDWMDEHQGIIRSEADLENPAFWPGAEDMFDYRMFDAISQLVPDDMKIIGGIAGGPFEHSLYLLGFEPLFLAMMENRTLLDTLYSKLDRLFCEITRRLSRRVMMGILRVGDDLGYKTGPMISLQNLRRYVLPTYRRMAEIAHAANRPFILHSCGNLETVMEDLISYCRIDAKHSFQDVIEPIAEAKRRWGDRIALLGGIDVDFLCRATPFQVKEQTKRTMAVCSQGGGFAVGSGSSVSNYVPVGNYLAMVEAVQEYNGAA